MTNTAVQVVPSNLQLPAHLQSPDVIAAIAAANAAAAGGVRASGFPTISIKGNHFHIKDGDETTTLMVPPSAPGQPALPMMCLEVVVVDANPALSHTLFLGEYVEGENKEPDCRSSNGVTPDVDVVAKQAAVCATCPQYAWGSKISKLSGKPIRACGDSKQLAVVPAGDLTYKMLGLQVKAGSLKNWGQYIQALTGRHYGVHTLVTNITFDQQQNGVLQFTFNRFLTAEEFAKVTERQQGDDVKLIVAQSRTIAAPSLGLPPPATLPAIGFTPPPVAPPAPPAAPVTTFPDAPMAAPAYTAPPTPPVVGFGASSVVPVTPAPAAPPAAEPAKRSRRTRAEMKAAKAPAVTVDMSHIPAAIQAAIIAVGVGSPAGQAILAAYPVPASTQPAAPVEAAATAPITVAPVNVPVAAAPDPAPTVGFGAAPVPAAAPQQPTAQVTAAGASLAEKLRAKLGLPQ